EAWCWRGDAHAISGRFDEAIEDYKRALALCPDLERARANLAVAERRKSEASAEVLSLSPPTPPPTKSPIPPASASGPSGKKEAGQLVVNCPYCDEVGEVPWNRLGKVFLCKACGRRFGVNTDGKAVELTEGPDGKWVETRKVREHTRRQRKRRLIVAGV